MVTHPGKNSAFPAKLLTIHLSSLVALSAGCHKSVALAAHE